MATMALHTACLRRYRRRRWRADRHGGVIFPTQTQVRRERSYGRYENADNDPGPDAWPAWLAFERLVKCLVVPVDDRLII
jgi:hypothetical protein